MLTLRGNIAVDKKEIFMVDTANHRVQVFSVEGHLLREWGTCGTSPGQFKIPWGIAVSKDIIYVVDSGTSRIQAFSKSGEVLWKTPSSTSNNMNMGDIVVFQDLLFVISDSKQSILVFQLHFG